MGVMSRGNTALQSPAGMPAVRVEGAEQVKLAFRELPPAVARKVVAVALMAGASPILAAARQNAETAFSQRTQALAKSIRAVARKGRDGVPYVVLGPIHKKTTFRKTKSGKLRGISKKKVASYEGETITVNPGNYAHLVEFGHGGPHPAPAHPFLRPAFEAKKAEAQRRIEERLMLGIEVETRRLAGKTS